MSNFKYNPKQYAQEQEFFYKEFDAIWPKIDEPVPVDLNNELATLEKTYIEDILSATEGNRTKAAKLLNIGRTCLIAKMRKFDLV